VLGRRANSVVRWGLAAILGGASLFGNQLHGILGVHHASGCDGVNRQAIGLSSQSQAAVDVAQAARCDDGTNCPICNFLSQGRIVGDRFDGPTAAVSLPNRSPVVPLRLPSPLLHLFEARGPPAV